MKAINVFWILAIICTLACAAFLSCGDDDDDDDDDDSGSDDDDDDLGQGDPGKLEGCVLDFQTRQPVQDAFVELLDDNTGEPLLDGNGVAITATSPSGDGCVILNGIPESVEQVGVRTTRVDYRDTYQFHYLNGLVGEEFLLVSESTASLVSLSLGIDLNPLRGFAAGALEWGSAVDENPIGCSMIEFSTPPDDGIYYFGIDELPTPNRAVTGDVPTNGQGTNPCCKDDPKSFYIGMNQPVGPLTITAKVPCTENADFCEEDGDGNFWYTSSSSLPNVIADSVLIADIYLSKVDFPEDPTPSWCTE